MAQLEPGSYSLWFFIFLVYIKASNQHFMKHITGILFIFTSFICTANQSINDSINVLDKTKKLVSFCEKIDFSDPNILKLGVYYNAAKIITYNGHTKANYANPDEKKYVDSLCKKVNVILGTNKDWHYGAFSQKSDAILYQEVKYRNSTYDAYSMFKVVFIKSKDTYYIMGIE